MRAPKVNGVQRAFQKLSHIPQFNNIVFEPMHIESGVQATPLSIDELMTGARQRAETAYARAGVKSLRSGFFSGSRRRIVRLPNNMRSSKAGRVSSTASEFHLEAREALKFPGRSPMPLSATAPIWVK